MFLEAPQSQGKTFAAAITSPFAVIGSALVAVLAALEYIRPGFVSLFLDFRLVIGAVIFFWAVAVATDERLPRGRTAPVALGILFVVMGSMLYRYIAAYGRLGLVVFGCGALALAVIFFACVTYVRPDVENEKHFL